MYQQFRLLFCIAVALCPLTAQPSDLTFKRTRLAATNHLKEIGVHLVITDTGIRIQSKTAGAVDKEIPYSAVTRLAYGFTDRRRLLEGLITPYFMLTKSQSHWLVIEANSGSPTVTTLRLDKSEYYYVITALNARSGQRVLVLDPASTAVDPSRGSVDVDETVPFATDRVMEALKPAMTAMDCKPFKIRKDGADCRRGVRMSARTGVGGENVKAVLEAVGDKTRVRITTAKGMGRNWSTPIFAEMKRRLEPPK